jgi:hypothetical protein
MARVALAAHHDVEADGELALVGEAAEEVDGREARAGVVEGGDAVRERLLAGELDLPPRALALSRACAPPRRACARDQPLRGLAQVAGRLARASRTIVPPVGSGVSA